MFSYTLLEKPLNYKDFFFSRFLANFQGKALESEKNLDTGSQVKPGMTQ